VFKFVPVAGKNQGVVHVPDVTPGAKAFLEPVIKGRQVVVGEVLAGYEAAHNFWVPGTGSILNLNSAVYILDRDGGVLSAVMISTGTTPSWWTRVAGFLFEQGVWKSPDGGPATTANAVNTAGRGTGVTWSISRNEAVENTGTLADWYISTRATPGRPNG